MRSSKSQIKIYIVLKSISLIFYCVCIVFMVYGPLQRFDPDETTKELYLLRARNFAIVLFFFSVIDALLFRLTYKRWYHASSILKSIATLTLLGVLIFLLFAFGIGGVS